MSIGSNAYRREMMHSLMISKQTKTPVRKNEEKSSLRGLERGLGKDCHHIVSASVLTLLIYIK